MQYGKLTLILAVAALIVLATGTRASAAIILPVIFVLLWLDRRRLAFAGWIYFALGGAIAALLVFGPFLLECPHNFIFFTGRFHTLRHDGNLLSALIFKGGFTSRVLQAYFVCFGFWVAAGIFKLSFSNRATAYDNASCHPEQSEGSQPQLSIRQRFLATLGMTTIHTLCNVMSVKHMYDSTVQGVAVASFLRRCIWISAVAVSLVHLGAPFPYDDYQVFIYPFFAIAVALMIADEARGTGGKWIMLAVLVISLASAVSSPVNQDWFIEGRELIWWRTKDKPPLVKLRATAARIRTLSKPDDLLLTQDPYLAVEANRALPHGLEMGQFSYFPDMTREQAGKLNVLNRDTFAELLQNCAAPLAALSGYALAIQSPQITPVAPADKALLEEIILKRYEVFDTVKNFGQASTDLRLYRRK